MNIQKSIFDLFGEKSPARRVTVKESFAKENRHFQVISERSILLNAKSTPTDDWEDSHGAKLNYTNWGLGHPAQRNYLVLNDLK